MIVLIFTREIVCRDTRKVVSRKTARAQNRENMNDLENGFVTCDVDGASRQEFLKLGEAPSIYHT
jgi:hypothetical protein